MFSGIVTEIGTVESAGSGRLAIRAPASTAQVEVSHSIAVNGTCLTVVEKAADVFRCDAVKETLMRTSLGALQTGDKVNLEPALKYGDPVGGHLVQGHVDGTGTVADVQDVEDGSHLYRFAVPPSIIRYVVVKGFVAVDGVSLTVAALDADSMSVAVIPHTRANTIIRDYRPGRVVNLEADLNAKYAERFARA